MRRKDMVPGTIYAIRSNGMMRPGVVLDSAFERIGVRVWWTWPPADFDASSMDYRETDYLDPRPDLLSPLAKFDDKIVKTNDVIGEWEPWATEAKAERAQRLQDRLDAEAQDAADKAAELASNTARVEALRPLLQDITGYLDIDQLLARVRMGDWTRDYYSARDVVTMLEHVASKTIGVVGS